METAKEKVQVCANVSRDGCYALLAPHSSTGLAPEMDVRAVRRRVRRKSHLHVSVINRPAGRQLKVKILTSWLSAPVPRQEGEKADDRDVAVQATNETALAGKNGKGTNTMPEMRSRPPSLEPETRMRMQATMLTTRVAARRSQSWKRRVMSGRDASGISSGMEW
jgi:hypothetical protein